MPAKETEDIDRLYELPLAEFIGARTELAKRLRKEGRSEEAAEVAALRKPTIAVWTVNQLARRRRRDIDLLLDAGHRLRAAQAERQAEKARQAFESARESEREAIARLSAAAEEILAEEQGSASPAMLDRVRATLRAAAVTEEGRELLARGRLTEEVEVSGFELAAALAPAGGAAAPKAPAPAAKGRRQDEVAAARDALKDARERQREAQRRLREAERQAAEARRALEAADAELEAARAEADEAASAADEAAAALKRAQRGG